MTLERNVGKNDRKFEGKLRERKDNGKKKKEEKRRNEKDIGSK